MKFLIADTFTDSLAKLNNDEQKAVKTTVFDLQINPANPGIQFHRIKAAKDKNFWSVRVSRDIRLIVHKTNASFLVCYADHHDAAYAWAERRRLDTHPKTGAAQMVVIRERVEEITIPKYVEKKRPKISSNSLIPETSEEELLSFGIPEDWLGDVKSASDEKILEIAEVLPGEAAEALLNLAIGVKPEPAPLVELSEETAFEHPDALRRFRVMSNVEELEQALEYPWEKWAIFLHPSQHEVVVNEYSGPARVSGSAGTGKTVVALHRAVYLAETNPDSRILITTFSEILANALRAKIYKLLSSKPRLGDQIEVSSISSFGNKLYRYAFKEPEIVDSDELYNIIASVNPKDREHRFSTHFLINEWEQIVDAWQLTTWDEYQNVIRLGRKTRLPESHRKVLWDIFEAVRLELKKKGLVTQAEVFAELTNHYTGGKSFPVDFAVIDEAQDISVAQLRFLSLINSKDNGLFFAGDLGQRIFQQPFSWKQLGVDIRGRSKNLRINYRTSHQIREQADLLLGPEITDVDGNREDRSKTISIFNGPKPFIKSFTSEDEEISFVEKWIESSVIKGLKPEEIGIFVRSKKQLDRGIKVVESLKLPYRILDQRMKQFDDSVSVSTMHYAKGLEFKAVVVMACDDEVIPSQSRIENVTEESDLEEVYNTERHLLYVACTRARDKLLVTGVDPVSEFIDDLSEI
mgnify:CR=1 FL=1